MNSETENFRISVAMTTYNGEHYVVKQMESILSQTRKPDEVIICDDGSTDSTVELVLSFLQSHKLDTWHFYQNSPNLGWQRNFFKASGMTTGDIIFFSDQDDIWKTEKIETMINLMIKYQMGCLFCEKTIIDGADNPIIEREEKKHYTGDVAKIPLEKSFFDIKTLGCCMCVSRALLNLYLELDFAEGGHDSQCGRLAVLTSSLWHVDSPLIDYRIHGHNTSGISENASFGQATKAKRIADIETTKHWMEKLLEKLNLEDERRELVEKSRDFQIKRLKYFNGVASIFPLVFNMGYYRNLSLFCGDIAYKHDVNRRLGLLRWKIGKLFE